MTTMDDPTKEDVNAAATSVIEEASSVVRGLDRPVLEEVGAMLGLVAARVANIYRARLAEVEAHVEEIEQDRNWHSDKREGLIVRVAEVEALNQALVARVAELKAPSIEATEPASLRADLSIAQAELDALHNGKCVAWAEGASSGFACSETSACATEWCPACVLSTVAAEQDHARQDAARAANQRMEANRKWCAAEARAERLSQINRETTDRLGFMAAARASSDTTADIQRARAEQLEGLARQYDKTVGIERARAEGAERDLAVYRGMVTECGEYQAGYDRATEAAARWLAVSLLPTWNEWKDQGCPGTWMEFAAKTFRSTNTPSSEIGLTLAHAQSERGRARVRAQNAEADNELVLAWLRSGIVSEICDDDGERADAIEAGEHRKWAALRAGAHRPKDGNTEIRPPGSKWDGERWVSPATVALDRNILEWAAEMDCEYGMNDEADYDPTVCSPDHTGRCWPCSARVLIEGGFPTATPVPTMARVAPTADGGVAVYFDRTEGYALIEIHETGEVVAGLMTHGGEPETWPIGIEPGDIAAAWERLCAFVGGAKGSTEPT